MRQGCRQAANWKRARRSRRATKTCRNEAKQRQADTIGSRALCVPPHDCCVLSAPRLQVHSHRCPLAGRRMHTAPRLPVLADQAEGKKVPTGQASGANMQRLQVHRCPQTWLRACRWLQVKPCRYPQSRPSRCKLAGAYHRPGPGVQVPARQLQHKLPQTAPDSSPTSPDSSRQVPTAPDNSPTPGQTFWKKRDRPRPPYCPPASSGGAAWVAGRNGARDLRFDPPAVVSREFPCVSTLPLCFRANSGLFWPALPSSGRLPICPISTNSACTMGLLRSE